MKFVELQLKFYFLLCERMISYYENSKRALLRIKILLIDPHRKKQNVPSPFDCSTFSLKHE